MELIDFYDGHAMYHDLMDFLFKTKFRWSIQTDANRAFDGERLRYIYNKRYCMIDDSPASVLEVLIALAKRCEDDIMTDDEKGDRTSLWFWTMIDNLNLLGQTDANFDRKQVKKIVDIFMDRKYPKNGFGSIFYTKDHKKDFRHADLWYQMVWYMDERFIFNEP